ncbi:MAG TPA: vWA domain-containing protein [Clostridiales bacterium]|jgi:hypothetical protein|nr:vWA domain-containing protein [Clostridiales bacterium]HQP70426.1 vWA domain-containing protein [Clostridiales bacterium]
MKKWQFLTLAVIIAGMFIWSCSDEKSSEPIVVDNSDIPADPGTLPPAVKSGPLKPNVAVKVDPSNPTRVKLNVGGLLNVSKGDPIIYTTENLTVVEDGVVQGIKITNNDGTISLGTDIVFIIDVTGSMSGTIDGVRASVTDFLKNMKSEGINVAAGAVAYADNYDSRIPVEINGIPDDNDPGAYVVVDYENITTKIDTTGPVYKFVDSLYAGYEGYDGGDSPEGGFDAIWWAYNNFTWREGAQKMFIVLTDVSTWGEGAPVGSGTSHSPWRTDELAAALEGYATVHVVSPTPDYTYLENGAYDMHWLAQPGNLILNEISYTSAGTGGMWFDIFGAGDYTGYVDLTTLPIVEVTAASSLVEFETSKTDGTEKDIRIVIDIGTSDGEVTVKANY